MELLLSGALSGAVGKSAAAPFDRVRLLYMTNSGRTFTMPAALKTMSTIWRNTGVAGMWRGNGAAIIRVVPHTAIVFTSFDRYERLLKRHVFHRERDVYSRLLAGSLAGLTATTLTYPLDVVRARMGAFWSTTPRYPGYFAAFDEILRVEGWRGLFAGLRPSMLGILPYAGISFATFETLKSHLTTKMAERARAQGLGDAPAQLQAPIALFSGASAALVAQTACYPLHVLRRRQQVNSEAAALSMWQLFRNIYHNEGVRSGLFKGRTCIHIRSASSCGAYGHPSGCAGGMESCALTSILPNPPPPARALGLTLSWLRGPLSMGITFAMNDFLKRSMQEMHDEQDEMGRDLRHMAADDDAPTPPPRADGPHLSTVRTLIAGGIAGQYPPAPALSLHHPLSPSVSQPLPRRRGQDRHCTGRPR